ncbi:uncharacterized protein CIMG_13667 [Coccidioides immitis RS]|uniref:Uncharacterized protein n=1 Tax=Coccidioides immitis (strain RS) TaxID=246410 RepID=A0A0D8JWB6_COCIM|nr:uncharacterized protein CIMG_13667 [Coccidioides immitis RS]KJF61429.1 hypothetical protein CIMG_13667 [Coccidioides immitis RS]
MTTRRWCEKVESYQREASKLGIGKSREPDVAERSSEMGPFGQLEWAASGTEQPTDLTTQDKKECEYLERERTLKGVEEEEPRGGGRRLAGGWSLEPFFAARHRRIRDGLRGNTAWDGKNNREASKEEQKSVKEREERGRERRQATLVEGETRGEVKNTKTTALRSPEESH